MVSKFTLHSSSLPKPQQAVPISIAPRDAMDMKVAKQAANTTTKRGFQAGKREISTDSGISSISTTEYGHSPPRARTRPRNLEMVMSGRHKFQIRDLDDSLSDDSVVPLPLPELPKAINSLQQPVNIAYVQQIKQSAFCHMGYFILIVCLLFVHLNSGLVRDEYPQRNATTPRSFNYGVPNAAASLLNSSLESESTDEEKVTRDNSTSEKLKFAFMANSLIVSAENNRLSLKIIHNCFIHCFHTGCDTDRWWSIGDQRLEHRQLHGFGQRCTWRWYQCDHIHGWKSTQFNM